MKITQSQYEFIKGFEEYSNDDPMWKETWKELMLYDHQYALDHPGTANEREEVKKILKEIDIDKLKQILSLWEDQIEVIE